MAFRLLTPGPGVSFARRNIQPPAQLYLTRDDKLVVNAFNSSAETQLGVAGRILTPEGVIVPFLHRLALNPNVTQTQIWITVDEGFLLNVFAAAVNFVTRRGQLYVQVYIARGSELSPIPTAVLIEDYVDTLYGATWPGGTIRSPVDGLGMVRSIAGTNPAAGAEVSETVPTGRRWLLHSVRLTLVTDATATNRRVNVVIDDGVNTIMRIPSPTAQSANTTINYSFVNVGHAGFQGDSELCIHAPWPLWLLEDWRIRTLTDNMGAGDNYAAPQLAVEELLDIL